MAEKTLTDRFTEAARKVGTVVVPVADMLEAAFYIREMAGGSILLPPAASLLRQRMDERLKAVGAEVMVDRFRAHAPSAKAGVTGANFALADTGTVVLESTDEAVRLATTLPERHFILLDPRKILADGLAAVPHLRTFHENSGRNYLAYITGPSRTADIERVLTIGVHGPRQLHVLLLKGLSENLLEM